MRGKPVDDIDCYECTRITPVGAGKTNHPQGFDLLRRDHPRRCGENLTMPSISSGNDGSPPQVRGKPELKNTPNGIPGITPAGAGKTKYVTAKEAE